MIYSTLSRAPLTHGDTFHHLCNLSPHGVLLGSFNTNFHASKGHIFISESEAIVLLRFITHRAKHFKNLFLIILMIIDIMKI